MLSPEGFDMAWHQYHGHLVDRLNKLTAGTQPFSASIPLYRYLYRHTLLKKSPHAGTQYASTATHDLLLAHARQPQAASLFNHASMAWANHQFFSTLSPTPPKMSPILTSKIHDSFSSPASLRATFIATANAMFGPGFVWLVRNKLKNPHMMENELSLLTTYLAGSPLPGAHYRKQEVDRNTMMAAGSFGSTSLLGRKDKFAYGGADLDVLLGVNTWQHVWLRDWGIGGKKRFLEEWWEAIDWDVVESKLHSSMSGAKADYRRQNAGSVENNRNRDALTGVANVGRAKSRA